MKRTVVLVVSLVAGLLAMCFAKIYLSAREAEVQALKDSINKRYGTMEVLCFAQDVPSGTALAKSDLGLKKVPAIGMRGQALTIENVGDIIGRRTMLGHKKGDVVFWADIEGGDPTVQGLSADVKKTMRAMSINCSGAASVSGMVRPNDHVDVIGTFEFGNTGASRNQSFVTCTILQNVLVLATGDRTSKGGSHDLGMRSGYSTVTLEVTPREAEMLAFAEQIKGRLVLTLRNRNDITSEKELPNVNFEKIRSEIEELNQKRQNERMAVR